MACCLSRKLWNQILWGQRPAEAGSPSQMYELEKNQKESKVK
jgi:hypothetical protein